MATCNQNPVAVVLCGHIDHGKSTILGRLLADCEAVSPERVRELRDRCGREARDFEFAHLIDSFREERTQGITIEAARVTLRVRARGNEAGRERELILIDAPGHAEFARNMVSGASRADAALLTISAAEGVRESTRRHAALLSVLGIRRVVVAINKMDLVGYAQASYRQLADDTAAVLREVGLEPLAAVPVAGFHGVNLTTRLPRDLPTRLPRDSNTPDASEMPWYEGECLLDVLLSLQPLAGAADDAGAPFRLPIQDVYPGAICAGTVAAGRARAGDELVFLPSGIRARVSRALGGELEAGRAVGVTLEPATGASPGIAVVARGQVAVRADERAPQVSHAIDARVFWLGQRPFSAAAGGEVVIKLATQKTRGRLERITRAIDAATLRELPCPGSREAATVREGEIAECRISLEAPLVVDTEVDELRRFVLVDGYQIVGGGVLSASPVRDEAAAPRKEAL